MEGVRYQQREQDTHHVFTKSKMIFTILLSPVLCGTKEPLRGFNPSLYILLRRFKIFPLSLIIRNNSKIKKKQLNLVKMKLSPPDPTQQKKSIHRQSPLRFHIPRVSPLAQELAGAGQLA